MVDVFCVPPDRAADYWHAVESLIRPALENSLTDFDMVARAVCNGEMLLWLTWDGTRIYSATVTQLSVSNGKRFCTIVACGGSEMSRWIHLIDKIEQFARDEGCASIVIIGRLGWQKAMSKYKAKRVTLEKEF